MKILVVFAHPLEESFAAAIRNSVVSGLTGAGHQVDLCDLYREGFDPVMSAGERAGYRSSPGNEASVAAHAARLRAADGVILVFPCWWFGMPAILKGWFERVWLPGVAYGFASGSVRPLLTRIRVFGVVTTAGASFWLTRFWMGDPSRKVLMRGLSYLLPRRGVDRFWMVQYGMNSSTPAERARFLAKVERRMAAIR